MSRIRVELIGGGNRRATIQVSTQKSKSQAVGSVLEAELPPLDATIRISFERPVELAAVASGVPGQVFNQELVFGPGRNGGPAAHRPSTSNAGARENTDGARLNPRFIPVQSSGTALGAGSLLHFKVDCQFLPVTDLVRGFSPAIIQDLDSQGRAVNPVTDPSRPGGTEVRLYENTAGGPRVWAVAFAPGNVPPNGGNLHTALFLMPKSPAYTDLSNVSLFSLRRYLLSAPGNMPFFIRCFNPADPLGNGEYFTTVTQAAMLEQLEQSRVPVLLAVPIPSGSAVVPTGGTSFRELMRSLRRAVHADELSAKQKVQELPATFRVCVSGFSRGADIASELLLQQQASVDEFYWLDPSAKALQNAAGIQGWVGGNDKRRLRLIGTTLNGQMHQLANQHNLPATRVSAMPETNFRRSEIYKAAVSVPIHTTSIAFPEAFHPSSNTAPPPKGSLSDATGIFLVSDGNESKSPFVPRVTIISRDLQNRPVQPPVVVAFTPEEIAGKARFGMLNVDGKKPPGSGVFGERLEGPRKLKLQQFVDRFLIGEILDPNGAGNGSVHQWATVGGLGPGSPSPRSGFKGFFQICLEGGDFPK